MISIQKLHKRFGGILAVNDASFTIDTGSITGLIGPNGAGKTTLFNIIAGVYNPDSGTVLLDGEDITGLPPHQLFTKGLLRTFQIAHEFSSLTVKDNLMMVPSGQHGERLIDAWFRPARIATQEAQLAKRADEVISFLQLDQVKYEYAGNLSGGQKKLLELEDNDGRCQNCVSGRGWRGVNRTLLNTIGDAILRLNSEQGYTFCMIEHDMEFISRLCDPVVVMAEGAVLATGSADDVRNNEEVIEAYLGTGLKNK